MANIDSDSFPLKVMHRSFFTAAVAAVTLKTLNPHGTGKLILLETDYESKEWHTSELPVFLLLGLLGGLYGAAFCQLNMAWSKHFRKLKFVASHPILEVVAVCLITSVVSYWNEFTQAGGTELVDSLLSECMPGTSSPLCATTVDGYRKIVISLLSAIAIKFWLTIITFGLKLPAGIFIPTMCIGALAGRIFGLILQYEYTLHPSHWFFTHICPSGTDDCIIPGIYAMIGAAATLAGVTRMTVSLAVIMFELTGSLNYVMPYMIAILTAKWVADSIQPQGIYDLIILLNDHPYLDARENHSFGCSVLLHLLPDDALSASNIIDVTLSPYITASELRSKVSHTLAEGYEDGGYPIVKNDVLVGYVALSELSLALDLLSHLDSDQDILIDPEGESAHYSAGSFLDESSEADLSHNTDFRSMIDRAPLAVQKEAHLELATEMFTKLGLRYLAVLDGGRFMGVIHKKRFVKFLRGQH